MYFCSCEGGTQEGYLSVRGYTGGVFICTAQSANFSIISMYFCSCEGGTQEGYLSVRGYTGGVFICQGVHRRGIYL